MSVAELLKEHEVAYGDFILVELKNYIVRLMLVVKRSDLKNSTLSILCVENPLAKELQVLPGLQREPELIYIEDSLKPAKIYGYWRQRPHKNEVIALSTMYALQQ